jgi:hypothetical protein
MPIAIIAGPPTISFSGQLGRLPVCGHRPAGDPVDPHPVATMFDVFADLGCFEAHVLDPSSQNISATVAA